ncbi:MAG: hypothetical protein R3228_07635 [Halioglobus sp.]|nr:hypothetical protein [Halioglobus sp.]
MKPIATRAASAVIALALPLAALGKEYNQTEGLAPEQQVKVNKVIAKSRTLANQGAADVEDGDAIVSEGEVNTDCGELSIGNVETGQRFGRQRVEVERDIIITGDVINVATDCRRRRR